ncbi:methyl-accepting chemotaxis protein [Roseateles asaccharophilus]|uniref:methyl-accepting chemotaxis protein n=1 Tax=Roseateles asaccharophilus TaxID=582607 RepID=UPI0038355D92
MSNRRITVASFSFSDISSSDLAIIAGGVLLVVGSVILGMASTANGRAAADSLGAARLLSASSSQVLHGAQAYVSGGSAKLGAAVAGAGNVGSAFADVAQSADSLLVLPSIKAPAVDAYGAWSNLRSAMGPVAPAAAAAADLSDSLGRAAPMLAGLVRRMDAAGKSSGALSRAYEAANRLAVSSETGFGAASVQRVASDLQILATDLSGTEFRQDIAFLEPLAPVTKTAAAARAPTDQLGALVEAAKVAKVSADTLGAATQQSSASKSLGLAAGVVALLGLLAIALGIKGASSEFSRRFTRATQTFRAAEQARAGLVEAMRAAMQDGSPVDASLLQSSAEMGEIARMVNGIISAARDKDALIERAAKLGLASNAEIATVIESVAEQVRAAFAALSSEVQSLELGAKTAAGMALDAKVLVTAADRAVSQSADATGVAQDAATRLDSMREVLQDTSKGVKRLGERSQEIETVVDSLGMLSEQISVLALNAQLEAERAGEAGMGFQTVAREVKALANRAEVALDKISGLVHGVQADARSAAESVERSTAQVVAGANVGVVSQALLKVLTPLAETMAAMAQDVQARAQATSAASKDSSSNAVDIQRSLASLEDGASRLKASLARNMAALKEVLASSSADASAQAN